MSKEKQKRIKEVEEICKRFGLTLEECAAILNVLTNSLKTTRQSMEEIKKSLQKIDGKTK